MQTENIGDYIRQLREQAEMPLRKLAALLDIDQSTLSKLAVSYTHLTLPTSDLV